MDGVGGVRGGCLWRGEERVFGGDCKGVGGAEVGLLGGFWGREDRFTVGCGCGGLWSFVEWVFPNRISLRGSAPRDLKAPCFANFRLLSCSEWKILVSI